jgi:hypothetical protein
MTYYWDKLTLSYLIFKYYKLIFKTNIKKVDIVITSSSSSFINIIDNIFKFDSSVNSVFSYDNISYDLLAYPVIFISDSIKILETDIYEKIDTIVGVMIADKKGCFDYMFNCDIVIEGKDSDIYVFKINGENK